MKISNTENLLLCDRILMCVSGVNCELEADECLSSPCQNGALCEDRFAEVECFCLPGFAGKYCEIDIDECAGEPCIVGK